MNNLQSRILLIALSVMLITSCAVEKRHHMSGYHINKKNNRSPVYSLTNNKKEKLFRIRNNEQATHINKPVYKTSESNLIITASKGEEPILSQNNKIAIHPNLAIKSEVYNSKSLSPEKQKKNARFLQDNSSKEKIDDMALALAGLIMGLIGMGIPAMVFSIIALNRISKEPLKKKSRIIASIGLALGIASTIMMVVVIVMVANMFK